MDHSSSYMEPHHFGQSFRQVRARISQRARDLRLGLNQSQASLAESAGISVATLKRFEAGENVGIEF